MIAIQRLQAVTQRIKAGLNGLPAAVGAWPRKTDRAEQRSVGNSRQRDALFAAFGSRWHAGAQPNFAVHFSTGIENFSSLLLERLSDCRRKIGGRGSSRLALILSPEAGGRQSKRQKSCSHDKTILN